MEAPEKIYVHVKGDKVTNTWNSTWIGVHDIEYIRKDAFIEKASKCIEENIKKWYENIKVHGFRGMTPLMITEFKKYMEE